MLISFLYKLQKPTEFDMTFLHIHKCNSEEFWGKQIANLSYYVAVWFGPADH